VSFLVFFAMILLSLLSEICKFCKVRFLSKLLSAIEKPKLVISVELAIVIAKYPAVIMIILGLLTIVLSIKLPFEGGIPVFFGCLGFFTLIAGLIIYTIWVKC
jgi:hypothetical protein